MADTVFAMTDEHTRRREPRSFLTHPELFGTDAQARWAVKPDDDPATVAAAYAQHRLIVALRESETCDSAAQLAVMTGDSPRTVQRYFTGSATAPLPAVLAWVIGGGTLVGEALVNDHRFFPTDAPPLEAGWPPGSKTRMRFAPDQRDGELPWRAIGEQLTGWVTGETDSGRRHLIDTHATATRLATLLCEYVPPGTISMYEPNDDYDIAVLVDSGSASTAVDLMWLEAAANRQARRRSAAGWIDQLIRFLEADLPVDRRISVVIGDVAILDVIGNLIPGITAAEPSEHVTSEFGRLLGLPSRPTGWVPPDLNGIVCAGGRQRDVNISIVEWDKLPLP